MEEQAILCVVETHPAGEAGVLQEGLGEQPDQRRGLGSAVPKGQHSGASLPQPVKPLGPGEPFTLFTRFIGSYNSKGSTF